MSETTSIADETTIAYESRARKSFIDGTINLKDESECEGRTHGFIYLHGYDPDLRDKVPPFVQQNIARTCKYSKVQPTLASLARMRTMTSVSTDDARTRRSIPQLPPMEE